MNPLPVPRKQNREARREVMSPQEVTLVVALIVLAAIWAVLLVSDSGEA